jgi:hypothetical protein
MSGKLHAIPALSPGKETPVPIGYNAGVNVVEERKPFLFRESNPCCPARSPSLYRPSCPGCSICIEEKGTKPIVSLSLDILSIFNSSHCGNVIKTSFFQNLQFKFPYPHITNFKMGP